MANPVGAISHAAQLAPAHEAPASRPAANVTKVTPQDTVNISAAAEAASHAKPAPQLTEDAKNGGEKK